MSDELQLKVKDRIVIPAKLHVYKFMKREADHQTVNIPLSKARQRTAAATGVLERVVTQINSQQRIQVNRHNKHNRSVVEEEMCSTHDVTVLSMCGHVYSECWRVWPPGHSSLQHGWQIHNQDDDHSIIEPPFTTPVCAPGKRP
ncbi:hypothetical protein J6590_012663 [Homalodisca vitripennis]|nr:hypothetical protein J6590_012663 [Homalodisca vitripennis]